MESASAGTQVKTIVEVMKENPNLQNRDYVIIMDASGSMGTNDCPGNKTRWDYAKEYVLTMAGAVTPYDPDGIEVIFFNEEYNRHGGIKDVASVDAAFNSQKTQYGTKLAPALNMCFDDWKKRKAANELKNGTTILVFTDGEANDQNQVAKAITDFTQLMDSDPQMAISFIQIGHDKGATTFLKKLDNDLQAQGAKFDIVDTQLIDDIATLGVEQVLILAVTD